MRAVMRALSAIEALRHAIRCAVIRESAAALKRRYAPYGNIRCHATMVIFRLAILRPRRYFDTFAHIAARFCSAAPDAFCCRCWLFRLLIAISPYCSMSFYAPIHAADFDAAS